MLKTKIIIKDESKIRRLRVSIERIINSSEVLLFGEKVKDLEKYVNIPIDGRPVNIVFIKGNKVIKVSSSVSLEINRELIPIKLKVWENII